MTDVLFDDINEVTEQKRPSPYERFLLLSAGVELVLLEVSHFGPIAYIETDYFGGVGFQSAIAWDQGRVLSGPFVTETNWNGQQVISSPAGDRAINLILRELGVRAVGSRDLFDTLGLGNYRRTSEDTD